MSKSEEKSTRLEFEYWKSRPAHSDPNVCHATSNDTSERHLMTTWQLCLPVWKLTTPSCKMLPLCWRCDTAVVSLWRQWFGMQTPCSDTTSVYWRSTLPRPTPAWMRNQRNSDPKNGTFGDEKQEWLTRDPPTQGTRFHPIKTFQYLIGANITIFICTSGFSQQALVFENIFFPFTGCTCNPLWSYSCNYCFHMNHYVLPTLQLHSQKLSMFTAKTHATNNISSRSNCKQASCSMLLT